MAMKWLWKNKATGEVVVVLAVVDSYAVVRFKGAMPFVIALREFTEKWAALPWP